MTMSTNGMYRAEIELNAVQLYSTLSGKLLSSYNFGEPPIDVTFSGTDIMVLTPTGLWKIDVASEQIISKVSHDDFYFSKLKAIEWDSSKTHCVLIRDDGVVYLYNVHTNGLSPPYTRFKDAGDTIESSSIETHSDKVSIGLNTEQDSIGMVMFSDDGKWLFICPAVGEIRIFNLMLFMFQDLDKIAHTIIKHKYYAVTRLEYSGESQTLALQPSNAVVDLTTGYAL